MKNILVVDDEQSTQASIKMTLGGEHRILQAMDGEGALQILDTEDPHLVILDIRLPGMDGMDTLRQIKKTSPDLPVVMLTATKTVRTAIEAMKLGASDYVTKPFDVDELRVIVKNNLHTQELASEVSYLRSQISKTYNLDTVIAESSVMREVWKTVDRVAKTESTILITGESGTGKELIARAVHLRSNRGHGPFVAIHCPSIPEALLESELFGHERGAYTGAAERKPGLFEVANSGTVFLDEISDMAFAIQSKLLRVIQEGEFLRVGGTRTLVTDVRIVAATNRDLKQLVSDGKFREDLYYRINVVPIEAPPLRQRREDILPLCRFFLNRFKEETNAAVSGFDEAVLDALFRYDWPGNVRELKNLIERAVALHGDSELVLPAHLPREVVGGTEHVSPATENLVGKVSLEDAVAQFERSLIQTALQMTGGTQSKAAELLGTTRRILKYRIDKLGIEAKTPTPRKKR